MFQDVYNNQAISFTDIIQYKHISCHGSIPVGPSTPARPGSPCSPDGPRAPTGPLGPLLPVSPGILTLNYNNYHSLMKQQLEQDYVYFETKMKEDNSKVLKKMIFLVTHTIMVLGTSCKTS